ncbi:hypothetical protein BVX94_03910 [bacterium B17]|nr:hypothetical protein BVX94_03910 [bacterium B17]
MTTKDRPQMTQINTDKNRKTGTIRLFFCIATSIVIIPALTVRAQEINYQEGKKLYDKYCYSCHIGNWQLWPRSYKAWQLSIENMRAYIYDENSYTDKEAENIARFLTKYAGENEILPPPEDTDVSPETVGPPEEPITSAEPEVTASTTPQVVPPLARSRRKRIWNPSRNALMCARVSGFLSVACLSGLLASGFGRKTLKRNFRKIHVSMALGLFVSLSVHGIIYIAKYGTPSVTWYWFGLIGFIALIATQVQGIIRKRFSHGLLASHIIGACVGLFLSILHWIWAWV